MDGKPYVKALRVQYHDVLSTPKEISQKLAQFLDVALDVEVMTQQVDASLHRNRSK